MKSLEEMYRKSFFARRSSLSWRVNILCSAVEKAFDINRNELFTIVDVGCATGEFVKGFLSRGISSYGIEGSENAKEFAVVPLVIADLRKSLKSISEIYKCDLCMCLEVAEHIEPVFADIFVENLCFLSDRILLSAAPPGSQGHGHFNCQEKSYWEAKFQSQRYMRNYEREIVFRRNLEANRKKKGINAYYQNTMIFEKKG